MSSNNNSFTSTACSVLIIGGGNAGFCAALAASQKTSGRVLLIDACPPSWAGGNTYFTAGAFRTAHGGLDDLLHLLSNVDSETAKTIDLAAYPEEEFLRDLDRVTRGQYDKELGRELVEESNGVVKWLASQGLIFELSFNRQAYKVDGRYKFFGGICLKTKDGGAGLVDFHQKAAKSHGIEVLYSTPARSISKNTETGHITVTAEQEGESFTIQTKSIVLAAGGFESSTTLRSQHMGSHWEKAHVRGTPYNKGEVLSLALDQLKAKPTGDWGGCHAVAWDANAPKDCGDRQVSNEFTKSGYPLGITLNIHGLRFFDEGSDLRNYTYAKFGRAILAQPEGEAFQIWDQKGVKWLRSEEYRDGVVEKIHGDTMEELAGKLLAKGLKDKEAFIRTVEGYNNSVYAHRNEHPDAKWDPAILDTLSTQSSTSTLEIPKSNWALPLDKAPFMAVKVGCGVTFTFGGLAIDPKTAGVISAEDGSVIPGVFCAGEMVGGLFYENYPGGSGLTSGAVFGRKAGIGAAVFAEEKGL